MIFGIMLDANDEEERSLYQYFRELTAFYTDERLEIRIFHKSKSLMLQMETDDLLDLAVIDVTLPGALDGARQIRKKFSGTEIMVIADVSVSPMEYIHPSIRASSLLLRPMTEGWKKAVKDFFEPLLAENKKEKQRDVLWVENRSGIYRIPFEQIFYLEAREKKVFIRTKAEEFAVKETLEKLTNQLPDNFKRCHRSFIVNQNCIAQISLGENLLYLKEGLFVPLSRSYRGAFKRHSNE